ncbi:MAG TPA: aa3-type cytochrome c oxidase subunit IV [Sphingomicrobium sp.]|nr:aa3-type cytochrome c oxidase subunit IV [Sphingomicrobium sp.]
MAVEPASDQVHNQDLQAHVRDYSGFVRMVKWGAIISFVIGFIVVLLISE